jgi:hypothetical protein
MTNCVLALEGRVTLYDPFPPPASLTLRECFFLLHVLTEGI